MFQAADRFDMHTGGAGLEERENCDRIARVSTLPEYGEAGNFPLGIRATAVLLEQHAPARSDNE